MKKKWKRIIILITMLVVGTLTQVKVTNEGFTAEDSAEDWLTYQSISEQNTNATLPVILVDENNNAHILWQTRSMITNQSQINYRIFFNNGSLSEIAVVLEQDSYDMIYFKAVIDKQNRIHLIYWIETSFKLIHLIRENTSWQQESELQVSFSTGFELMVDNSNTLHLFFYNAFIYKNLCEVQYKFGSWSNVKQITNYTPDDTEHIMIYGIKCVKCIDGQYALLYTVINYFSEGETDYKLICKIHDVKWQIEKVICEYISPYDMAFDDTGRLHVIWSNLTAYNMINYQTSRKGIWSEISNVELFELPEPPEVYFGYSEIKIKIQGTTRFISYSPVKIIDSLGYDYDFFITSTENGSIWDNKPVYSNNDTRTSQHLIESTTDGTVFAIAVENSWETTTNYTIYFGYYNDYFTYKSTKVIAYPTIFIVIGLIPLFLFLKKLKRSKS